MSFTETRMVLDGKGGTKPEKYLSLSIAERIEKYDLEKTKLALETGEGNPVEIFLWETCPARPEGDNIFSYNFKKLLGEHLEKVKFIFEREGYDTSCLDYQGGYWDV